jgi:hypothetical protein
MYGQASSTAWGDTVTVTINNVSPGQVYDIKCKGATTGDSGFGAYGLQVNFGSMSQPPVTAPDTTMAEQADQGGGTLAETSDGSDSGDGTPQDDSGIPGVPTFWVYSDGSSTVSEDNGVVGPDYTDDSTDTTDLPDSGTPVDGDQINVGSMGGYGDALMINPADEARLERGAYSGVLPWTPAWQSPRAIPVARSTLGTGPNSPILLTALDVSFGDDRGPAVSPDWTNTRDRKVESPTLRVVDTALQGWNSDPSS